MHAALRLRVSEGLQIRRDAIGTICSRGASEHLRLGVEEYLRLDVVARDGTQRLPVVFEPRDGELLQVVTIRPCVKVEHGHRDHRRRREHHCVVHLVAHIVRFRVKRLPASAVDVAVHNARVARAASLEAAGSFMLLLIRKACVAARRTGARALHRHAQVDVLATIEVDLGEAILETVKRSVGWHVLRSCRQLEIDADGDTALVNDLRHVCVADRCRSRRVRTLPA